MHIYKCKHINTNINQLKLMKTDFDPRTYGFKRLNDLIKGFPQIFECDERTLENGHKHLYVKLK